ncbi:MAG: hypothetical protein ABII82_12985 [Verrucomicrobiota bacterium]
MKPLSTLVTDAAASPLLDHPMIFGRSRLQLVPPPTRSFAGFTSLNFQGRRNWKWETFFRPFLRIETSDTETAPLIAGPDRCSQTGGDYAWETFLRGPDLLEIRVRAEREMWMHLGPCGTHENYGGLVEQEFLVFWGNSRGQSFEDSDIVCRVEGSAVVFHAPGSEVDATVSGYRVKLQAGENRFAVAAGDEAELEALKTKAHACLGEAVSVDEYVWRARGITGLATVRERAIWTIASSTFEPEGRCARPFLGACKTAYTKGSWLWDTCFAVRGYASADPVACMDWLRLFIDHQREDGMLPGLVAPTITASVTQVPLFAWAANAVLARCEDEAFLRDACEAARRNNDWWMTLADPACDGLPATQPISYDNSPLYDALRIEGMKSHESLVLPDIIAALVIDCDEIAAMARTLGDAALAERMTERRAFLAETGHRRLYDAEVGYYFAARGGEHVKIKTGPALTALVYAPKNVVERIVAEYLKPGSPAWPRHGIATMLTDQPAYDPDNFWRGMIWGPVNRLVVDALERCGQTDAAERLRVETLRLFETDGHFHEVYDPVSGRGRRGVLMSGFGAGVYLDLLAGR